MLGIVIINYNKYEKTIDCVNSIFETVKTEYKIYLLDNASQNDSFEQLSKHYNSNDKIVLIKSSKNLGYARGNNLGIEYAKRDGCDYILISNNDLIYQENAIDTLYSRITASEYFIVEPFLKNIDGSTQTAVMKSRPSFKEYMQFSTYLHNFVSKKEKRKYYSSLQPKEFGEVYWASGACFIADLKQFEEIGFFDPYTFLYFEEYIISEKAKAKGLKIGFEPNAKVVHYHGASTGGNANLVTRVANFKSEAYMFTNYWKITKQQLKLVRLIRCLEVLYTFTKEHKIKDAFKFIKQSKIILRETPVYENKG